MQQGKNLRLQTGKAIDAGLGHERDGARGRARGLLATQMEQRAAERQRPRGAQCTGLAIYQRLRDSHPT